MSFTITSSAFNEGQDIPAIYTCDGEDISPPLEWAGVPQGAQSLVLIVDDPDAPDPEAPKMTWVHWVLYNLPPNSSGLPEAIQRESYPSTTLHGNNNWERTGYGGPCPPIGQHRYFIKLYALDKVLPDLNVPDKDKLLQNMQGHVLAETTLMGTFQR